MGKCGWKCWTGDHEGDQAIKKIFETSRGRSAFGNYGTKKEKPTLEEPFKAVVQEAQVNLEAFEQKGKELLSHKRRVATAQEAQGF
jgi:hypothetical protein